MKHLQVGAPVEGHVTNITKMGFFIDIGAEKDGLLPVKSLPPFFSAINVGDFLPSIEIKALDGVNNRITLQLSDSKTHSGRWGSGKMKAAGRGGPGRTISANDEPPYHADEVWWDTGTAEGGTGGTRSHN